MEEKCRVAMWVSDSGDNTNGFAILTSFCIFSVVSPTSLRGDSNTWTNQMDSLGILD